MSCDGNRARFLASVASDGRVLQVLGGDESRAQTIFQTIYDTASQREDMAPALADALTRVLFQEMKQSGLQPPAHAANGLPKPAARQGYAALAQTLMAIRHGRALPALALRVLEATPVQERNEAEAVAEVATYGARSRRGGRPRAPDAIAIVVGGRTMYVSGADFGTLLSAVRRYANTGGDASRYGWRAGERTWYLPGTLADAEAALGGFAITPDRPTAVATSPASAPAKTPKKAVPADDEADDAATPDDRFLMPPNTPPGDIPSEVLAAIVPYLRDDQRYEVNAVVAFANGGEIDAFVQANARHHLEQIAKAVRTAYRRKRTDLPLVYWARQYTGSNAKAYAFATALLGASGHPRCPECGQFLPAANTGVSHTCPSTAFGADGYNGFGRDRYGLTRYNTSADGTPLIKRRKTVLDAAKDFVLDTDPINNTAMADLWGRIASAVAGHECRIVLREGGGFATDMEGTIYAEPYPLGKDADPRHNLIVTKAGIYHEIGHELTTPPEDWAYLLEVASGKQTIPGIDEGKRFITKMYNIIEDGRMERDMSNRFLGVAETLAAQCQIYPRWGEQVGAGVPLVDEVIWPLLYTVLPYFSVRDEVREAMTPAGRALFEELEPIALSGAFGTTEDSLAATIEITRRLEAAGIFDIPETSATAPPKPPKGTKPRSAPPSAEKPDDSEGGDASEKGENSGDKDGSGADTSDEHDDEQDGGTDTSDKQDAEQEGKESSAGKAGEQGDEQEGESNAGQQGEQGSENDAPSATTPPPTGDSAAGPFRPSPTPSAAPVQSSPSRKVADTTVGEALTSEQLEGILNDLESQAVSSMEREITRQGRYDTLGGLLHAPLTTKTGRVWDEGPESSGYAGETAPADTTRQRYRTPSGEVVAVQTGTPIEENPRRLGALEARRPEQQEISGRLARRLDSIRQDTITRLRMQQEGRLDRRRFPAALAGREDIRSRTSVTQDTGMAVSVLLDQSGSMRTQHIATNRLYDATCIIGQSLEQIQVPYEVRGHGGASTQYKAMDDVTLDPRRAARLSSDCSTSNAVTAPVVGLATASLLARPDANKLIVNLMDGDMEDHEAAVAQYQETRKQGIVTFGVFLGRPNAEQQKNMTELFGTNNWRPIATLTELPTVVGQRIADIFESLGGEE